MKGHDQVIKNLNEALKNELTAVNQYWLHYRMLDNWGVKRLAEFERHESIDEMKHADRLAERILFLEGLPNFQMLGRLRIGETVEEALRADLELEREAVEQLKGAIAHAESVRDSPNVTFERFELRWRLRHHHTPAALSAHFDPDRQDSGLR